MLFIAMQPPGNPASLNFERYTLAILAHDYPAKTPALWNHAYRAFDMSIGNIAMLGEPACASEILQSLRHDPRYLGGGAGVGFKEIAAQLVDGLDPQAREIGSVNLLQKTAAASLFGYNTDGEAYAQSLDELFQSQDRTVAGSKTLIIGAGGTASAIAVALARRSMHVSIVNRNVERARLLANRVKGGWGGENDLAAFAREADVVINTSTKGATGELADYSALAAADLPASDENIRRNHRAAAHVLAQAKPKTIFSDVVLAHSGTRLLNTARQACFVTLDGVPMVLNQAAEGFWILHREQLNVKGATRQDVFLAMRTAITSQSAA